MSTTTIFIIGSFLSVLMILFVVVSFLEVRKSGQEGQRELSAFEAGAPTKPAS